MLSMIVITAILAVALPHLRITTLGMLRTTATAYALAACTVVLNSVGGAYTLYGGALVTDILSTYMLGFTVILLMVVLSPYSSRVVTAGVPYPLSLLLTIFGVGAYYLMTSDDIVTLALGLEVQSFALYSVASLHRWHEGSTSAGLMYFMLGAFSSGLVFLGLSLAYAYTGETSLSNIAALGSLTQGGYLQAAYIIVIAGLLFKVTAAPFHYWGPDVYDRVPTLITVILSVVPKVALFCLVVRVSTVIESCGIGGYLIYAVILSWIAGSVVGLVQSRIKRLLAYSTVNHVGWVLAAVLASGSLGLGAYAYYIAQYSVTTAMSLLALLAVSHSNLQTSTVIGSRVGSDVEEINSLQGLIARGQVLTAVLTVSLFSAAGIPPMVGFYAKLAVMQALLYTEGVLVVCIAVLTSVVSAGFYLSVIAVMVFNNPGSSSRSEA